MTWKEGRKLRKGDIIYFGGCPVEFIRMVKMFNWMVEVYDELPHSKHIDRLLLVSVSKKKEATQLDKEKRSNDDL